MPEDGTQFPRENPDLLVGCGKCVLVHGVEFFVKPLAGTHAGKFDLDVFIGPQIGEQNQVSGKIDDLNWVPISSTGIPPA